MGKQPLYPHVSKSKQKRGGAKLNLYDDAGDELVAIVASEEFEVEAEKDGIRLVASVELEGDFILWPTDRFLSQV